MKKILFIDNFDSFTFNLVEEFEKRNCNVKVYRNNISMNELDTIIQKFKPELIVISPGASTPEKAGNTKAIIKKYYKTIPIFGVCLGHQAIIEVFGGKVGKCSEIVHGKHSKIIHNNKDIFKSIENPMIVGRYHSLTGIEIPECLEIIAKTENDIVMSVKHKNYNVFGVQFHPESILTSLGGMIIENILKYE